MDAQGRMLPFAATRQRVGHYSDWCVLHRAPIGMPHLDLWITRGRLWLTPSSTARGNIQVFWSRFGPVQSGATWGYMGLAARWSSNSPTCSRNRLPKAWRA